MATKKSSSAAAMVPELQQSAASKDPRRIRIDRTKEGDMKRGTLQFLSHTEIDRRIDRLAREVMSLPGSGSAPLEVESRPGSPRWISPAELVDRLRPFVVFN